MNIFDIIPLPYRILGAVVVIAGALGGAYITGRGDGANAVEHRYAAQELARTQQAARDATRIHNLEQQLSNTSAQVVTQYVDRVNTVTRREYVYRDAATNQVPAQNTLSNGWIYIHDLAASVRHNSDGSPASTNGDADPTRASDATPSGIADNQALSFVVTNYGICSRNAEQLAALQQWIRDSQQQVEASNRSSNR